nr:hypothetical protein Iba_chr07aCG6010 [Ipomoea batatas]
MRARGSGWLFVTRCTWMLGFASITCLITSVSPTFPFLASSRVVVRALDRLRSISLTSATSHKLRLNPMMNPASEDGSTRAIGVVVGLPSVLSTTTSVQPDTAKGKSLCGISTSSEGLLRVQELPLSAQHLFSTISSLLRHLLHLAKSEIELSSSSLTMIQ